MLMEQIYKVIRRGVFLLQKIKVTLKIYATYTYQIIIVFDITNLGYQATPISTNNAE